MTRLAGCDWRKEKTMEQILEDMVKFFGAVWAVSWLLAILMGLAGGFIILLLIYLCFLMEKHFKPRKLQLRE